MLKHLPIRTKLALLVGIPFAVLVISGIFGLRAFRESRVGGPRYAQVISTKDLVADVLPPPGFIIQAELDVLLLTQTSDSADADKLILDLVKQEQLFQSRQIYWNTHITDEAIRASFLQDANTPALAFFDAVTHQFLPAYRQHDEKTYLAAANGPIAAAFKQHRAAIDQVVTLATAEQKTVEDSTSGFVRRNLAIVGGVFALGTLLALLFGAAIARSIIRPIRQLRKAAIEDLPATVDAIRRADLEHHDVPEMAPITLDSGDELAEAAAAFNAVVATAIGLAGEQVKLRRHTSEMFVKLGHRNQTFIGRQLELIDTIQANVVDPDMLGDLFELDHMVTRMRRNSENLLLLAGTRKGRSWSVPVPVSEVIGGGVSETGGMARVNILIGAADDLAVKGEHAFDLSHLIAEVVDNAITFSGPATRVAIRVQRSEQRMRVWIIDNGIGMSEDVLADANRKVSEPPGVEELSTDQVGFQVAARLARRLNVRVRLQTNPQGGTAVNIDLPSTVFADAEEILASQATLPAGPGPAPIPAALVHINVDDFADDPEPVRTPAAQPAGRSRPAAPVRAAMPTRSATLHRSGTLARSAPASSVGTSPTEPGESDSAPAGGLPTRRRTTAPPADADAAAMDIEAAVLPRRRSVAGEPVPTDGPRFDLFAAATRSAPKEISDEDVAANARRLSQFARSVEQGRSADVDLTVGEIVGFEDRDR